MVPTSSLMVVGRAGKGVLTIKAQNRIDATWQIGTGHFMRCLMLADLLKKNGAQVRFICYYLPRHLRDMLLGKADDLWPRTMPPYF